MTSYEKLSDEELDKRERQLLKDQAGWRPDSPQHAKVTAELNRIARERIKRSQKDQRMDKYKIFALSQVIPLIALCLSLVALTKSCNN
jgi:hypothetical protein